jgi:hypothetical protein
MAKMLISVSAAALVLLLVFLYGVWKYQEQTDNITFNHKPVNPDILPADVPLEKRSSDTIQEIAEYAKEQAPLHLPEVENIQPVPPPAVVVVTPPVVEPVEQPTVPEVAQNVQPVPQPVVEPPTNLQERSPILDVENPIVQPPPEAFEVDIPTNISRPSEPEHDSEYGVRHSPDNPGRILRDKRYNRNDAD